MIRALTDVDMTDGPHRALLANGERLAWLKEHRGLTKQTIKRARLGLDNQRYTIPIYDNRRLVNVRRYKPEAKAEESKMLHTTGHGKPVRWYWPFGLDAAAETQLICEGELDAVLAAQEFRKAGLGVCVASGTGGASSPPDDLRPMRGRDVVIVYDCDEAGRSGARKLADRLLGVAASVKVVDLGLDAGQDVTDWFVTHGKTAQELVARWESEGEWYSTDPETAQQSSTDPSAARAVGPRRDADELVEIAVTQKCDEEGSRNAAGLWLAAQLRDERYSQEEAEPFLLGFQGRVTDAKPKPYTREEALRSLASAYSRPPREANGASRDYGRDDTGNGQRLVDQHGDDMRYIDAYRGWHIWDGRRWVRNETGHVERWAKETARQLKAEGHELFKSDLEGGKVLLRFATQSANSAKIAAMLKSAQSELGMSVPASAFDRDPTILVCRSGVVELGESEASFREHRREDYARLLTDVDYDPSAPSPTWSKFLCEVLPDPEVRRYVQALAGYSLHGGNPERLLIFLHGPTSTGKTTFMETLGTVLGDYAGTFDLSMFRAKQDESPRADIVDAIDKRLIFTTEAAQEWRLHADQIKRMTGSDTIKARLPHSGTFIEKVPAFTPWIATNSTPQVSGVDTALWRRLRVVPFVTVPEAEDRQLKRTILRTEAPGVLRWVVEGWPIYRSGVLGDPPLAVVQATMTLREQLHHVDQFLKECTESAAEFWTSTDSIWQAYVHWTIDAEISPRDKLAKDRLGRSLGERGYEPKQRRIGDRDDDRKVRGYRGVRIAKSSERSVG